MNIFILRIAAIIIILLLLSYFIEMLYNVDFVPAINVFIRNFLYIIGLVCSLLLFLICKKWILTSATLKIIMLSGLVICNIRFFLLVSMFNSSYNETIEMEIDKSKRIYISRVSTNSRLIGNVNYFRIYKDRFPLSKTLNEIYASEISMLYVDSSFYVLKSIKKNKTDTIYIPRVL